VVNSSTRARLAGLGGIAFALLMLLATGKPALPARLRWLTAIAGGLGLASVAFFPSFVLPIWALIIGLWLLTSEGARRSRGTQA
jgi:hypothetical protein